MIPKQGSLGASGDLIPLAYIAQGIQGQGNCKRVRVVVEAATLLSKAGLSPYVLKPKEGLAIVNGTSAMTGVSLVHWMDAHFLTQLATLCSAWLCICLEGRTESFGDLVNEKASRHSGQAKIASWVREALASEEYKAIALTQIPIHNSETKLFVQDKYSLRCFPQVLGPVLETLQLLGRWVEEEINTVSDNPLFDAEGRVENGGNFYGGYLSHGMDYLKISMGNLADLMDRQLMLLIDEKTNRGLTPNLAAWSMLSADERHLHHGLKGLHQAVSAVTSEVLAKSGPNSIFSRSSESHNQEQGKFGHERLHASV